jgi:pyridinium-3,5-bisthiocarboxylic acid mononucleotide nickel chelatase
VKEKPKVRFAPKGSLPSRSGVVAPGHGHAHGNGGHSHGTSPGHGVPVERGFVATPHATFSRTELERGAGRGKVLFFDCSSGIAGDMTLSSLLDLGVPRRLLDETVAALGLEHVELVIEEGYAGAIGALHLDVVVSGTGKERSYAEIRELLERAPLPEGARTLAKLVFLKLATAEAEVHRATLDDVHFHEVGAVDALVDIVGSAVFLDYLGAEVIVSPLPMGRGFVKCRHGMLPLPAPATLLCLKGVPTVDAAIEAELVTPTGAAIVSALASSFAAWPALTIERVGMGAGTRGLPDRPNVLRAILGTRGPFSLSELPSHVLCETNLDDMTGEALAFALEAILRSGAVDAWFSPVTMKKGRPGVVLSVLAPLGEKTAVVEAILRETRTIGVRQTLVCRTELERRIETVETRWGPVRFKLSGTPPFRAKPEFDDCAEIARRHGLTLEQVVRELEPHGAKLLEFAQAPS